MDAAERSRLEQRIRAQMRVRVKAGVAQFDRTKPGWDDEIDLDILDLGSEYYCIVGQLAPVDHGEYGAEVPDWLENDADERYPSFWGLDLEHEDYGSGLWTSQLYSMLTEEWLAELKARRVAREASASWAPRP